MKKRQQTWIRLIAFVLAGLLVLGIAVSAISGAYAEEAVNRNDYTFSIEYLEEEQALRMSQRLVYTNVSGEYLDRLLFYAPANMFRRESALMYESEALQKCFPKGYVPGGIELLSVRVNGENADYGFQDINETCLRVACDLQNAENCTFEFEYYLLLTQNLSFLGISENEWRLSDFYLIPAGTDPFNSDFIINAPLPFTHYVHTDAADYSLEITLPNGYGIAATGSESYVSAENQQNKWLLKAENARDFCFTIQKSDKEATETSAGGVEIRLLGSVKDKTARKILQYAVQAVNCCEAWFGAFPFENLDIVQSDYAVDSLTHSAVLWLGEDALSDDTEDLAHTIYTAVAKQYFGYSAYALPVSDAWLSDSVSEYIAYLILEACEGHDAYLRRLNDKIVDSLQLTIPGGLNVASDASLFTAYEYEIVILNRGAAVFHELRTAMGRETLLDGLALFYQKGQHANVLTEMDLVYALDEASGKSWEAFLTDWVFNIGDYVDQSIDWLD